MEVTVMTKTVSGVLALTHYVHLFVVHETTNDVQL